MIQINPNTVTHLKVFNATEGVFTRYSGLVKCSYIPYRKGGFFRETVPEGYYEDGIAGSFNVFLTIEHIEESKALYIVDENVYTKAHIDIYVGNTCIHTQYFPSNEEMEAHIQGNYSHVKIVY